MAYIGCVRVNKLNYFCFTLNVVLHFSSIVTVINKQEGQEFTQDVAEERFLGTIHLKKSLFFPSRCFHWSQTAPVWISRLHLMPDLLDGVSAQASFSKRSSCSGLTQKRPRYSSATSLLPTHQSHPCSHSTQSCLTLSMLHHCDQVTEARTASLMWAFNNTASSNTPPQRSPFNA